MDKINVKADSKSVSVKTTSDLSNFYSDLSKKWAVSKVIVEGTDYSSKYYANLSKNSAVDALKSVENARENAISELARDASKYIKESQAWADESQVQAGNALKSAQDANDTVNNGVESIKSIIQSTPEKFAGFGLFDTKFTDHILEGQDAVGWALQGSLITTTYPDAVAKIKELYENGTDIEYRGITCRRSTDGRYVADVAQKDAIDTLFTESGVADFYILDVDNNQFYLPRSKWFNQMTIDTSLVNNFNEAGLPNIEGQLDSATNVGTALTQGAFYTKVLSGTRITGNASSLQRIGFGFDASKSNPLYGNSDTVQPPSSNKLLYYKVGNTVVNESQIDVGKILVEVQSKADKDLTNTSPSQAFKNMSVGWGMPDYNSIIQVSIPYTAVTNGILYTTVFREGDKWGSIYVNGKGIFGIGGNSGADNIPVQMLLNKGDTFTVTAVSCTSGNFIPLKGAG